MALSQLLTNPILPQRDAAAAAAADDAADAQLPNNSPKAMSLRWPGRRALAPTVDGVAVRVKIDGYL